MRRLPYISSHDSFSLCFLYIYVLQILLAPRLWTWVAHFLPSYMHRGGGSVDEQDASTCKLFRDSHVDLWVTSRRLAIPDDCASSTTVSDFEFEWGDCFSLILRTWGISRVTLSMFFEYHIVLAGFDNAFTTCSNHLGNTSIHIPKKRF